MILHQIESLAAAGVKDIVLAVNYRPEVMIKVLQKVRCALASAGGIELRLFLGVTGWLLMAVFCAVRRAVRCEDYVLR